MTSTQQTLQELDDLQQCVERWYHHTIQEMNSTQSKFSERLKLLEDCLRDGQMPSGAAQLQTQLENSKLQGQKPQGLEWESLLTPTGSPSRLEVDHRTPSLASPPVNRAVYDATDGQFRSNNNNMSDTDRSRPTPDTLGGEGLSLTHNTSMPADRKMPCQVLVEFKRKRVLQFESPYYVAPGEYVVVGGDRGEDIGLVTHSWPNGQKGETPGAGRWSGGVGMGKVVRVANVLEVSQLQGVQTELESRAVDVAQEKVREHQLPMKIVDAEYQFDRKKLTFYYQSQHRLDFRNLVRDLYKTFRARIWMEQDVM